MAWGPNLLGAPCGLNATAPLWQCGVTPGPWWVQNATASLTGAYSWSPEWLNATAPSWPGRTFRALCGSPASPKPQAGDANATAPSWPGRTFRALCGSPRVAHALCRGRNATMPLSWGTNFEPYGLKPPKLLKLVAQPLSPGGLTLCASSTQCGWRAWKGFSLPIPSQNRAKSPRLKGSGGAQRIGLPIAATSTRASSRYEEGRCEAASPLCICVLTRFIIHGAHRSPLTTDERKHL